MITKTIGELPGSYSTQQRAGTRLFSPAFIYIYIYIYVFALTLAPLIHILIPIDGKIAKPYDERVDFWSLGVTAYAFLYGMCPFYQVSDKSEINEATRSMELEYDGGCQIV